MEHPAVVAANERLDIQNVSLINSLQQTQHIHNSEIHYMRQRSG